MKKGFCVVAIALAMVLAAGTAYSWDFTDHVTIAPNGKGDAIIFPFWVAKGGFETNFYITNTSDDYSVVAKVVLRSQTYTAEVLDYFIFMSPNDVYKATIKNTPNGVVLACEDDSMISGLDSANNPIWANQQNLSRALRVPPCELDVEIGYLEVFEVAYYPLEKNPDDLTVPKNAILDAFGGVDELGNNNVEPCRNDTTRMMCTVQSPVMTDANTRWQVAGDNGMFVGTLNVLAGHMDVYLPGNDMKAAIKPTVFRNYDTSLEELATLRVETYFGDDRAHNSLGEVEAALGRNYYEMPYSTSNMSYHAFTFPTKLTLYNEDNCRVTGWRSPYFNEILTAPDNCVEYTATSYDMMENSKQEGGNLFSPPPEGPGADEFCAEVNVTTGFPYDAGWVRYVFEKAPGGQTEAPTMGSIKRLTPPIDDIAYEGVPVIGTVLDFHLAGENRSLAMVEGSYTDGIVRTWDGDPQNTIYYYYQYWDRAHYPSVEDMEPVYPSVGFNWGYRTDNDPAVDLDGDGVLETILPVLEGDWPYDEAELRRENVAVPDNTAGDIYLP